ncbi:P-loop containing nucleoside triphosphate hydrolase protein [Stachybotrys elegans]|uniref:P-loop containing nucleoside triphosphate hydrolase protein n=1 Tax=Stachybotrys elegans TaxID=80388 RepID=A0A8K0SP68_9HYPO|nr:P-loop containing nucleoside triphosphate hydrolase protein [Stachybotrys elegans]
MQTPTCKQAGHKTHYHIQLAKNKQFTGRTAILDALEKMLFGEEPSQKTALVGLGGVGKTQIALRFAYRVQETRPDYSIFWVPVLSEQSAVQAYTEIARKLDLRKMKEDEDIRELVCRHLNSDEAGKWLLIIDNADDQELVFGANDKPGVEEYLPQSKHGVVLLTTRSTAVAANFAGSDVIDVEQMNPEEAADLLRKSLSRKELVRDEALVADLLTHLIFLPLAITQAAAYLNQTRAPLHKYLELLQGAEKDVSKLLGREFKDNTRYRDSRNAVGTTWLVSFDQIAKSDQAAVQLLSFISCIEPKAIPQAMLPQREPEELEWAIGTLCSYSFLIRQEDSNTFDMHSLVHIATRNWLAMQGRKEDVMNDAVCHLVEIFPSSDYAKRDTWRVYLPHTIRLLGQLEHKSNDANELLEKAGNCLYADRRFKESIRCREEEYRWKQDQLDKKDHSRLASEHALASAYLEDRRIKDAITIFEHVVAVRKETLDEKDHNRLTSEHELASAYLEDRRIKDAITIFEHIVAVRKEILDEKDHSRLTSEHELASAYLDDRRTKDAIMIFEHVVAVEKEILDEKDHSRLTSEHELARAYLKDQRIKDAITILEHVVAVEKETLDKKDHSRLASEHALASAYLNDRRIKDAIIILEHVVAVRKETLDKKDHDRLASEYELARAYLTDK